MRKTAVARQATSGRENRNSRHNRATLTPVERRQLFAARVTWREGQPIAYLYSPLGMYTAPTADLRIRLPR